jgi:hypothetical protein
MDLGDDGDGGLRLHLGCGTTTPAGWVNVDGSLGARLAQLPALRPLLRATGVFRLDWSPSIRVHDASCASAIACCGRAEWSASRCPTSR